MFEGRKSVCVACCAVLLCSVLSAAHAADDKRIAVVNVSDVFTKYDKVKDVQEKLKKDYKERQDGLDAEGRAIKVSMEKLQVSDLDPESPELFREKLSLEQRKFDYQTKLKKLFVEIEERRKEEMKKVLNEIKTAIRVIGQREKYDLVMRAPEYGDEFDAEKGGKDKDKENQPTSAQELVRRFRDNPVLFFASGVDITEKVVDILNADYRARPK